jgi:hypothetical protein
MIRTVKATRYVTPLREGGSLPAIVEADDDGLYVAKFRGAGQGPKALIAELVAGEIARSLGLLVPEIVFIEVDPILGRSEPDGEIRELVQSSGGLNLALDYLPGALSFEPLLAPKPDARLASQIVWFDSLVTNVDRTYRNVNMLMWHRRMWLIDHGAALYVQHTWTDWEARSHSAFPQIREHVLLPFATELAEADAELSTRVSTERLEEIAALIPETWLDDTSSHDEQRALYVRYLRSRLEAPRAWVEEAIGAQKLLV